jgi:hypothetical protein
MFARTLSFGLVVALLFALAARGVDAACAWRLKSFSQGKDDAFLPAAVASTAANDVWVVGSDGYQKPLIRHWDGTSWQVIVAPVQTRESALHGVAARTASDAWAVGNPTNGLQQTTGSAIHFDGSSWTDSTLPAKSGYAVNLNAVAYAGTGVWAVGGVYPAGNSRTEVTYVLFHGKQWQHVVTPNIPRRANVLTAVSASSPTNVWAVGSTSAAGKPLIEHWNGKWQIVPAATAGAGSELTAVYAVSNTDVWATGFYGVTGINYNLPLFEHWDGKVWSVVPSPVIGSNAQLYGLGGNGANDIFAVGLYGSPHNLPLSEHWDGTAWSIVPTPQVAGDIFVGVTHVPGTADYWAAGQLNPSGMEGLAPVMARYDCTANLPRFLRRR